MAENSTVKPEVAHLFRRAGFGVSQPDTATYAELDFDAALARLVDYESIPDDVDAKIGTAGHLSIAPDPVFKSGESLILMLQRWVFRMVHSQRPLQEKMTLFWHHHFATGRSKIIETFSFPGAVRAFAARPADDPDGAIGQIELFRKYALGNFQEMLLAVSRDPAMVAWLDGHTNVKGKPQENFARELMELFTIGVNEFAEEDVYAAARVFTGWNLEPVRSDAFDVHYRGFRFDPAAHDTGSKTFSFAIYPDGGKTIPARNGADGYQDGLDLIAALAAHPKTGRFLSRKLYQFFVNDEQPPDEQLIERMAQTYYASKFEIREVVRAMFESEHFRDPATVWSRYSWPAEYVVRMIKEVGWQGLSADVAVFAMMSMGQCLLDPPNVAGWPSGKAWFSTATMLSRMNFAMTLCWNQQANLAAAASPSAHSADSLMTYFLDRFTYKGRLDEAALGSFLLASGPWSEAPADVSAKGAGLAHLITSSGEYQYV